VKYVAFIVALALLSAGCGGDGDSSSSGGSPSASAATSAPCPRAWKAGWQRLADDVGAPVYCPRWMPPEVDAKMDGRYKNGRWVDSDKSYLVSFLWLDQDAGVSREVHVNFRGYPGQTAIPKCESTHTVKGTTFRKPIPCFSDPQPETRRLGDITATVYTANQGIDEWHVLYAWKHDGSLYTASQHVASPYSYRRVVENLDRMTKGLVLLQPTA
jgi:hypothetical protein